MKRIFFLFLLLPFLSLAQTGTITTFAGTGAAGYSGDGSAATGATLRNPSSVAFDAAGNAYIADDSNHCVRKISTTGVITTVAGTGTLGFTGDGAAATLARLHSPSGVAVDAAGNLFIADRFNNRIRKVTPAGIISTVAGNGTGAFGGDGGAATTAQLYNPYSVAVDGSGNLVIADLGNHRVRKVTAAGNISTIAGTATPGYIGDFGVATAARLNQPIGVAVDAAGNIYIADWGNNVVRKINGFAIINTIAGDGSSGFGGDGSAAIGATLAGPNGLAVDALGYVYIADSYNNRIRRIDLSGNINTIAGSSSAGFSGDHGPATTASLNYPVGISIDPIGNAYIADNNNNRIRKVLLNHVPYFTGGLFANLTVCESTTGNRLNSLLAATDSQTTQTLTWSVVTAPVHGTLGGFSAAVASTATIDSPTGVNYAPTMGFHGNDTFRVRVSDGLSADTLSVFVLVNPLPIGGYIVGADSICPTGYETLTNITGTAGGTWRHIDTFITLDSVSGYLVGIAAGTEIVTYSVTNSCGTATATLSLTVNPAPISGTIYGPDSVCIGGHIALFDTSGTPGGVWTSSDTSIVAVTSSGVVTGIGGGTATIYYNAYTNCGSAPAFHSVSVTPNPGIISGADSVCPGDTIHFLTSFRVAPGAVPQHRWLLLQLQELLQE